MDKICRIIAHLIPNRIKFYAGVFILAYSTSGEYGRTIVHQLSALEALDRFYKDLLK